MSTNERALAEEIPVPDFDTTPEVSLAGFDLDAWIAGVRPTRRSIKLYPDGHLVARLEELADQIDNAPDGENVDALVDEFEQIRTQFHTGVWFTVEKRSSEWIEQFRKQTATRLGLKLDADGNAADKAVATTLALHQLAAQTIEPAGVTAEQLRAMLERNEGELNKLLSTMVNANTKLAQDAGVLTRDFSQRHSRNVRT